MENWKFALSSIRSHKMRSFLTMLGIIIGVAAVVLIMGLGNGMRQSVTDSVTGDKDTKPLAIGGATYARAIPNAVGFGPVFPYEAELAHEPNEFASIDSLIKAQQIYYRTLERICKSVSSEEGDAKNVCQ